jgi:hypothetical protein
MTAHVAKYFNGKIFGIDLMTEQEATWWNDHFAKSDIAIEYKVIHV